ncbi:MAG: hypothetical protein IJS08_16410 [Victivallales bacterium]|nr:hypothetical protein [Victivallales bacterium]
MRRTKNSLKPRASLKRPLSQLAVILKGQNNTDLPREYWERGCLFKNFANLEWRRLTGIFPATMIGKTHPLYVIEASALHEVVCPCSSKNFYGKGTEYIPRGSVLEYTGVVMDKNSFVLRNFACPLAPEERFEASPHFLGSFPPEKLEHAK